MTAPGNANGLRPVRLVAHCIRHPFAAYRFHRASTAAWPDLRPA